MEVQEWDQLVTDTYGKPYAFQQQDDCKDRGLVAIDVPEDEYDYKNDTIPFVVNGEKQGVSFKAWLAQDPATKLTHHDSLFWGRNFYPHVSMIVNDLHKRGLLEEGEFSIDIDW